MCNLVRIILGTCLGMAFVAVPGPAKAADSQRKAANAQPSSTSGVQQQGTRAPVAQPGIRAMRQGSDQTNIDFEDTLLEGQMRTPTGSFLQGRMRQDKREMVRIRTWFGPELRRSRTGVNHLNRGR